MELSTIEPPGGTVNPPVGCRPILREKKSDERRVVEARTEREELRALDEERPLLRIQCLEDREIQDGLIDFHLAEVGIDGRIEREVP